MRGRIWQSAFGIAVIMHLLILSALGYALRDSLKEEIQYIEVTMDELFAEQPDSQPPAAGQQAKANQATNTPVQQAVQTPVQNVAAQPQESVANVSETPSEVLNSSNMSTGNLGTGNGATGGSTGGAGSGNGTGSGIGGAGSGSGTGHGTGHGSRRSPHVISGGKPPYPTIARENGWEGTVSMRVLVSTAGTAQEIQIAASSGHDCLDEAADGGVRRWRFSPALNEEGYPVVAWVTFPVTFDLTN